MTNMYIKTNTYNKITSLGKNKLYYYLTVTEYATQTDMNNFENQINEFNFNYDLGKIDVDKDLMPQIYELLLQEEQFKGGQINGTNSN